MTIQLQYQGPQADVEFDLVNLNGLQRDAGLETAVILSLFQNARATEHELTVAGLPLDYWGGYWGDTYPDIDGDIQGSKLWLLARGKRTAATLDLAEKWAGEALQWLVDDNVAASVKVTPSWHPNTGLLILRVDIQRPGEVEPRWSRVWEAISGAPVEL